MGNSLMLGAILAVLSAASFALNNVSARRAVITGTPLQGMAVTLPVGVLCFLPISLLSGALSSFTYFPPAAVGWMAGVGFVHFVLGRYCNYRANQAAGVNLTAPVIQLQVAVTLVLAVLVLHESCTVLQLIGAAVMLAGALMTQRQHESAREQTVMLAGASAFVPRRSEGYLFATLAALAYGTSPIMARTALQHGVPSSGLLGGLIAYGAGTMVIAVLLLAAKPLQDDVLKMKRENLPWFVGSGVLVALAQGLFYAAVAVEPLMLVMPLLQLSLIFRLIFANLLSPKHEVFGPFVLAGSLISIAGACAVSIDTEFLLSALAIPEAAQAVLRSPF
jgi:drug/metabolite transporter (DMT)-like permease